MLEFALAPENIVFAVCLCIVVFLAFLETVSMLVGSSISEGLDSLLPDFDSPDAGDSLAEWLNLGALPSLIVFVIFLMLFAAIGYGVQGVAQAATGALLSPWLASLVALVPTIPLLRVANRLMGRLIIREETTALHSDTFIGHSATVTLGETRKGVPSQAKFRDQHGQTHYIVVESLREGDAFKQGDTVILVRREGAKFFVVAEDAEALLSLTPEETSSSQINAH